MKVSLNWVKRFTPVEVSVEELAGKIGTQLGEIEEIVDVGARYRGVVVAKVVSCDDHPNADRLHVCLIDDGGKTPGVARDEQGRVQVVCGAPNVRAGLLVAWLPPGSTVPESVGKEPFVLGARELRGVVSNGMLASLRELALGDSHEGILEIDKDVAPGSDFASVYGLDDYIIDIENKMFTHRPDCFGQLGVAREIAGILGQPFHSPDWYQKLTTPQNEQLGGPSSQKLALTVRNELPAIVPRFMAVALGGITVKPSSVEMQSYLNRVGVRPINNVVDMTNYMMLLTGQPLHAYDYDKVASLSGDNGATLVVRNPHENEKITLLNGKTIDPRQKAIMIATDRQLIGVGGVMGGADTEVDDHTTRIILECATFDMYSIRRTSMAHGLFTDAVTRFNKGQSPLQNPAILYESMRLLHEQAGAQPASTVVDDNQVEGRAWVHPPVPITPAFINARLGLELSAEDIKKLLENVEFSVELSENRHPELVSGSTPTDGPSDAQDIEIPNQVRNDKATGTTVDDGLGTNNSAAATQLTVTAPFWRTDIETREDVVEEVGRLYGYDHLPLVLPQRSVAPVAKNDVLELKSQLRDVLSTAGANELLTYSFVHGNLLDKAGQDKNLAFGLSNALSPELQYYRLSLLPSLLDKVHANVKAGYDTFALFEMGKAHDKNSMHAALPLEFDSLALVYASRRADAAGSAYYEARKFLVTVAASLGQQLEFVPLREHASPMDAPFALERSATVCLQGSSEGFGVVGEFAPSVQKGLKLPGRSAGFEVHIEALLKAGSQRLHYTPLPRFPKIMQDTTLKVPADTPYQRLYDVVWQAVEAAKPDQTWLTLGPRAIFQRDDDPQHKHVTLRLTIASYEKTMRDAEVTKLLDQAAATAAEALSAERV